MRVALLGVMVGALVVACGDSEGDSAGGIAGSAGSGGAGGGTGGSGAVFTGDCSSAQWADVTAECWNCICQACAAALDGCDETCVEVVECAIADPCLVSDPAQLLCEAKCVGQACVGEDPDKQQAASGPVTQFDLCLISANAHKQPGEFRACEGVCQLKYSGDVCDRHP